MVIADTNLPSWRVPADIPCRTQSQDAEIREAFALFDKRGQGAIPRESLGDLLRALGQNPTQQEVADLASQQSRDSECYYSRGSEMDGCCAGAMTGPLGA